MPCKHPSRSVCCLLFPTRLFLFFRNVSPSFSALAKNPQVFISQIPVGDSVFHLDAHRERCEERERSTSKHHMGRLQHCPQPPIPCIHSHTHTHTYAYIHTHTPTYTHSLSLSLSFTHTQNTLSLSHIQTHTLTNTHTRTLKPTIHRYASTLKRERVCVFYILLFIGLTCNCWQRLH